jgi:putative membrane protein
MKVHENFARLMVIGGLSLSVALAQAPATSTTGTPGTAGQSGQTDPTGQRGQTDPTGQRGQSREAGSAGQQTGSDRGHAAGTAGSADQPMIGQSDHNFMMKAAQGGMMEVQLAQMAQQKAASDEVKQYAQRLEQDHTKANEKLKQIAEDRRVSLPTDLGKHQQEISKFENLSGEAFDRAYIQMQVKHHKKDISEFRKQSNRGMDTDLKEFASATLPTLEQHLQAAQQLQTSTRSRKADTGSTAGSSADRDRTGTRTGTSSGSTSGHEGHDSTKPTDKK